MNNICNTMAKATDMDWRKIVRLAESLKIQPRVGDAVVSVQGQTTSVKTVQTSVMP